MKIGSHQGGFGIGEHFWEKPGDVVEVAAHLGEELLARFSHRFFQADVPAAEPEPEPVVEDNSITDTDNPVTEEPPADPEPAEEPTPEAPAEEPVPTGSVATVMAWVGDDKAKAQRALDFEKSSGLEPRLTLIRQLRSVLDA